LLIWAPSIAPSGLAVYRGETFPDWSGQFILGALAAKTLVRAQLDGSGKYAVERERMKSLVGVRVRDVREGPDGAIYVLTDEPEGELLRLCAAC
jgi:glucose/arabinose dehydrogenase